MFSTLLRQQVQLVSSARLSASFTRQFLRGLPKVAQRPHALSQRAFSISCSLSEQGRAPSYDRGYNQGYNQGSSGRGAFRGKPMFPRRGSPSPVTKRNVLHIGNIPYSATEADLRGLFESYGPIKRMLLGSEPDGRMSGYGFVEFDNLEDAVAAAESSSDEPFVVLDRTLRVTYSRRASVFNPDEQAPPSATLHIPNFPLPGEEAPLRHMLQEYENQIIRVTFMKDHDGMPTKKVFIQFSDQETATAAYNAFQEYNFEGTVIRMLYARNRLPPRPSKMADFDA